MPTTLTYTFTGGAQSFTVPAAITTITVELWGAEGGAGYVEASPLTALGGRGGWVKAEVTVSPGDVIEVLVPGKGGDGVVTPFPSTIPGGYPCLPPHNTGYNYSASGGGGALVWVPGGWRVFAGGGGGGGGVWNRTGEDPIGGDGGFTPTDGGGELSGSWSRGGTSAGPGMNRYAYDPHSSGGLIGSGNIKGAGGGGGFVLGNGGGASEPSATSGKGGAGQGGTSGTLGANVTVLDHATGVQTGNGLVTITFSPSATGWHIGSLRFGSTAVAGGAFTGWT